MRSEPGFRLELNPKNYSSAFCLCSVVECHLYNSLWNKSLLRNKWLLDYANHYVKHILDNAYQLEIVISNENPNLPKRTRHIHQIQCTPGGPHVSCPLI